MNLREATKEITKEITREITKGTIKKITALILITSLLSITTVATTAEWNNQTFTYEGRGPILQLLNATRDIITKSVSKEYFNKHFKIINASFKEKEVIITNWELRIDDETIPIRIKITKGKHPAEGNIISKGVTFRIANGTKKLKEIQHVIPKFEIERRLKSCKTEGEKKYILTKDGDIIVKQGKAEINIVTGKLDCHKENKTTEEKEKEEEETINLTSLITTLIITILSAIIILWMLLKRKKH